MMSSADLKPSRLKKRRDFLRIQRHGMRARGTFVVVMTPKKSVHSGKGRFGLVTPKAIGKAHDRNKIKRRLRHIISEFPALFLRRDCVVLATESSLNAGFDDLKEDVLKAATQLMSK